ncbi:MAG: UDP-N-acetylglucosamine 2-epimerase [Thermodesulfobacteriota bacterium]
MIHIITGTKAQLIKMAPILRRLKDRGIDYNHISTGQHHATMDEISANFGIKKPDRELYSGRDITAVFDMLCWSIRILWETLRRGKKIFRHDTNGIVLVHGDTFSTLLGALMGRLAGLKVAHVESGLRSHDLFQPFPEEIFRLVTFRIADILFCPGARACGNVAGLQKITINTKENSLLDSLKMIRPITHRIQDIPIPSSEFGLVSLHRFENFSNYASARRIVDTILQIAESRHLVFILHKFTEERLAANKLIGRLSANNNIELRPRYDYVRFMTLLDRAEFLISDGGSNQEECYYMGKPLLILRNVSEREQGLGRNALLSRFDPALIRQFIQRPDAFRHPFLEIPVSPSDIIVAHCLRYQ